MLKGLVGTTNMIDLAKNNVMAIIAPSGFEKGKLATMRILKNVMPGGKDYVTKSLVVATVITLSSINISLLTNPASSAVDLAS